MERRVFNSLPEILQTDQNRRETAIADDILFEPEQAAFTSGVYIGDTTVLTAADLARVPPLIETDSIRQKYQISIGAAFIDPSTAAYASGAFYTDLLQHLSSNGALIDNPNRVFDAPFYAWTPPVDYDKHLNFVRYIWTGVGAGDVNGEYVTKEPAGSQTTLYKFNGIGFDLLPVSIMSGLPASGTLGQLVEDASTSNRLIYRWDGAFWAVVPIIAVADLPTEDIDPNGFYYICRTGPSFNRPLLWVYKVASGRWISTPVVVSVTIPDTPRIGMVWENPTIGPNRRLNIWNGTSWQDLIWTGNFGPSGSPQDGTYVYDLRMVSTITDGWSANNWWRHYEDLSSSDRANLILNSQAVRPIVEFWASIETTGAGRTQRNQFPTFKVYSFNSTDGQIESTAASSTIFQYKVGSGAADSALGFGTIFNDTGEIVFDLTLESQAIVGLVGYRFFKDVSTGLVHSVWAKSNVNLQQAVDANGLYDVPKNITANADHGVLLDPSRSKVITHMASVMAAQSNFQGEPLGNNSYRFTDKNPTIGATLLDHEGSLLRTLTLVQDSTLSIPDAIRQMAREYNRVMTKFLNRLTALWNDGTISTAADRLVATPQQTVDAILSLLFAGRNQEFPFWFSSMGTYLETQITRGVVVVLSTNPLPIMVPNSAPRITASQAYTPQTFTDINGIARIRGHDGSVIPAFGDDRDLVVLELENRFFNSVPVSHRTESTTFSARYESGAFHLGDHYGGFSPVTTAAPVSKIVVNYLQIVSPATNLRVFSTAQMVYAIYSGTQWLTQAPIGGDIFLNQDDGLFYVFNDFVVTEIPSFNNGFVFEYSDNEYRRIVRRDFERFSHNINADFVTNTTFDQNNPFTWNFHSVGVEGNYQGIYRRVYGTVCPHSRPWEIAGYHIQPDWWVTTFVPTRFAADGTPRYANTHAMWNTLRLGIVNPLLGITRPDRVMVAPIPVDTTGELLDPIAAGIIPEGLLNLQTISDDWVYGDGGPTEMAFYNSYLYPFAVALAGYLMKPAQFVNRFWSGFAVAIGNIGTNLLWHAPHIVNSTSLVRPHMANVPTHLTLDASGKVIKTVGLDSWIAEKVVINGGSATTDLAVLLENSVASLGWKTAGFINRNRTNIETLSHKAIPFEDLHIVLHQAPVVSENFQSGITIVRDGTGYRVFGYDLFNPFFRTEVGTANLSNSQTEQRETIVATASQHSFATSQLKIPLSGQATFAVVLNGFRMKDQFVTVTGSTTFTIDTAVQINTGDQVVAAVVSTQSSPSTQINTFVASGVTFGYFSQSDGQFIDIEYGHFFETAADVVNFMVGHGRWLASQGWVFEQLDGSSQIIDWLGGAKAFANFAVTTGRAAGGNPLLAAGATFTFTAMSPAASFQSDFGQILPVESISNGAYGVINQTGTPIRADNITTTRDGDTLNVSVMNTTDQIYGLRVHVSEIQHVVFFSNTTKFNDLIYDPVLALFQKTLRVDTYRTTNWSGRMEAPGFIISGSDLLPNFDKQAQDITRFYDRRNPVDDPLRLDQARNLYGYEPKKDYLEQIDADDRSEFDFYLGAIHAKGTNRAFKAFARGTRAGTDNLIITEDWAWKAASFGDSRFQRVRFSVTKNDFQQKLQIIRFVDAETAAKDFVPVVEVLPFNRQALPDPRWIIPPTASSFSIANLIFPVDNAAKPDVNNFQFSCALYDTVNNETAAHFFHWDPALGRHDPTVISLIDLINVFDPARYSTGPLATFSSGELWGVDQVGSLWWDTSRAFYRDYRSLLPRLTQTALEWGKPKYFHATISRTSQIVTVTTLDPLTGAPAVHGLVTGSKVSISGADQTDYNVTDVVVTVTTGTVFTFVINTAPVSPATGAIQVIVGDIAVYEWVESPVPPDQWTDYIASLNSPDSINGVAKDALNSPSYVQSSAQDSFNNPITLYYFWVRTNTSINPVKGLATKDVEGRLRDPVSYGIPLFGVIDANNMFVFTNDQQVQDGFVIDVTIDHREMETHVEWDIISEGDSFDPVPTDVVNKLLDSLAGKDILGNSVPNHLLSTAEQFGTGLYPAQTVFPDPTSAFTVYLNNANKLLQAHNLTVFDDIVHFLKLASETAANPNGYWTRVPFVDPSVVGLTVYDEVASLAERDKRASVGLYADNDLVHVVLADEKDLWTGALTGATYQLQSGQWVKVGIDNHSVAFNTHVDDVTITLRQVWAKVQGVLTKVEFNSLIFALLYEMMRQNPVCDWFFKTSYLTAKVQTSVDTSVFVRPTEFDAIFAAIEDLKPFRTKVRSQITSLAIPVEDFSVTLEETPADRITLLFDRLSCNLLDDGGWDAFPWDTQPWDKPFWAYADLGRQEFRVLTSITCDSSNLSYTVSVNQPPSLYPILLQLFRNGVAVNASDIGVTMLIGTSPTQIMIMLSQTLNNQYSIQISIGAGFYEGLDPTLTDYISQRYPDLTATPSNYQHAVARLLTATNNPCTSMAGCALVQQNDDLGGRSEERLVVSTTDSVNIKVTVNATPAYSGWDTTPWDTAGWDTTPTDIGSRSFFVSVGQQPTIPQGVSVFPTSEDFSIGTTAYVIGSSSSYQVAQVWIKRSAGFVQKSLGVHWNYAPGLKHVIQILPPAPQTTVADGISTGYTFATENGIDTVFRNGILQQPTTDYTITNNGQTVSFRQPAPEYVFQFAFKTATSSTGNGSNAIFPTGQSQATLSVSNMLVFVNSVQRTTLTLTGSSVNVGAAPANGQKVLIWAFGNTGTSPVSYATSTSFTSNGVQTDYSVVGVDIIRGFVFVNGIYQILGTDYTIPTTGTVHFLNVPTNGATVLVYLITRDTIGQHVVKTTGGGATETLPGVFATKKEELLVFVGHTMQDGYAVSPDYTIVQGNPCQIQWTGAPPAGGSTLSVRRIQTVTTQNTAVFNVVPHQGDFIKIIPHSLVDNGSVVRLVYNAWDLGAPKGSYLINTPPGFPDYDIFTTTLIASTIPVAGEIITVSYNRSRLGPSPMSLFTNFGLVVSDVVTTRTIYDPPSGFETNRVVGVVVASQDDGRIWQWSGTQWIDKGPIPIGTHFYATRLQTVFSADEIGFTPIIFLGQTGVTPPVLGSPAFGEGITFATYAYGTMATASTDFPDAFAIMQITGDAVVGPTLDFSDPTDSGYEAII